MTMMISILVGVLVATSICFIIFVLTSTSGKVKQSRFSRISRQPTHLLIVLGSGGHTEEMLSMLRRAPLDFKSHYVRRTYVCSFGDAFSASKAAEFEREISRGQDFYSKATTAAANDAELKTRRVQESPRPHDGPASGTRDASASASASASYAVVTVPRARKVHQSFLTAPLSTLHCLWACLCILQGKHPAQAHMRSSTSAHRCSADYPGVILTNGPGTAVCVIVAALALRVLNSILPRSILRWLGVDDDGGGGRPGYAAPDAASSRRFLRTIFIESWARVTTLSLSGRIVLPIVDRFLVQWEGLAGYSSWLGGKTEYAGTLVS